MTTPTTDRRPPFGLTAEEAAEALRVGLEIGVTVERGRAVLDSDGLPVALIAPDVDPLDEPDAVALMTREDHVWYPPTPEALGFTQAELDAVEADSTTHPKETP